MRGKPLPNRVTTRAPNGTKVSLTYDYWKHIKFRHPEVGDNPAVLMQTVAEPAQSFPDEGGGIHALRKFDENHFLVVIYDLNDEGFIRTAYIINQKRKKKRYGA